MRVYEFGDQSHPVILLLPGTCCLWNRNFGQVIDGLAEHFYVACVSYDGFDETEKSEFHSMLDETAKIEEYVKTHYNGHICAAYGCSLGGSFVGLLIARHQIEIDHGILGGSDLDQSGNLAALLQTKLLVPRLYHIIQDGKIKKKFLRHKVEKGIQKAGAAGEALIKIFDIKGGSMRFVSKKSIENQFYSDLTTPLPDSIFVPGTKVHILYALKMGKKYRERYLRHFVNPDIIELDLQHEELLVVYPEKWIEVIKKIVLIPTVQQNQL